MSALRRLTVASLLLVGMAGAAAWAWSSGSPPTALVGTDRVSVVSSTTTGAMAATSSTVAATAGAAGEPGTTTAAPDAWPGPLPSRWHDRMWITLPRTGSSPERSAPVTLFGREDDPDGEWSPTFGTVEVYRDERLALPCEGGAVFALGHANYSTTEQAWDFFYDVIDSERYGGDHGLVAGQQVVITLDDGTELCRYEVFDLAEGPGEHLATGPGRYFLKTALSGDGDDPTGGPDDQLIRRAWDEGEPTIYLLGSYAGPSGDEMDASGVHQAYNFVVAARLVGTP